VSLTERPFVGTASRLLTLFALLEQISAGTEAEPIQRVDDLRKMRVELDAEIARVLAGDVPLPGDMAVKDRFQQFQQLARELLADFREVEHNFRQFDRILDLLHGIESKALALRDSPPACPASDPTRCSR
jgi:hypothetical protein